MKVVDRRGWGDLCSAKRTVTGWGGVEGGGFTHFREKRHGMDPKSDGDYKV